MIINFVLIFFSILTLIYSLNVFSRMRTSLFVFYLSFFILYILPIFLDFFLLPNYSIFSNSNLYLGFAISYLDINVNLIYSIGLLFSVFIFFVGFTLINKNISKSIFKNNQEKRKNLLVYFYIFLLLLPTLMVLILPISKFILFNFGWRDSNLTIEGFRFYTTIEKITYISITTGFILLMDKNIHFFLKIPFSLLILFSINIQSKRSIIFFFLLVIFLFYFYNKKLKIKTIFMLIFLSGFIIIFGSLFVKIEFRGYDDFLNLYTNLRIDFFRIDRVKMIIFNLIYDDYNIISIPGLSFINQIPSLFPLQFLGFQSIGFNSNLTAYLIGNSSLINPAVNWMTTSILDEFTANFSYFSFVLVPLFIYFLSHYIDKQKNNDIKVSLTISLLLYFLYPIHYISWYFQFTFLIILINKYFLSGKFRGIL